MKSPKLTIDEVMLVIDTYFKITSLSDKHYRKECVAELSENLKKLPVHKDWADNPKFRTVEGVNMLLLNTANLDEGNKTFLRNASSLQEVVYNVYVDKKKLLSELVKSILKVSNVDFDYRRYEEETFYGGNILLQYHKYIEKTDKIILRLKKEIQSRHDVTCFICKRNLTDIYGKDAYTLIEQHYAKPLREYYINTEVLMLQVLTVCPECHKVAHSEVNLFEENWLRKRINYRGEI